METQILRVSASVLKIIALTAEAAEFAEEFGVLLPRSHGVHGAVGPRCVTNDEILLQETSNFKKI